METDTEILERLRAPFPADWVQWRLGSTTQDKKKGMAIPYMNKKMVIDRLNEVLGPVNWQDEYVKDGDTMTCKLLLRFAGEWITKSDGAGQTDIEGEKGAYSDAFKRAAMKWGIGLYLNDVPKVWIEVEPFHGSFRIPKDEYEYLAAQLTMYMKKLAGVAAANGNGRAKLQAEAPKPAPVEQTRKYVKETDSGQAPAAPEPEIQASAPWTVKDLYDLCCEFSDGGKAEVNAFIRGIGTYPSLRAIPDTYWRQIARHFLPPFEVERFYPNTTAAVAAGA